MCWCTPALKVPNCGRPGCHPPGDGQRPVPEAASWRPPVMVPPRGAATIAPSLGLTRPPHVAPPGPGCSATAPPYPTHNPEPPPSAEPRYDGAAMLSRLSGLPKAELLSLWDEVKANRARLESCSGHRFDKQLDPDGSRLRVRWECSVCRGTVDGQARAWYELGKAHGAVGAS